MNSSVNQWLVSGEYESDLDRMLTAIIRSCQTSNSEATTASIFEKELYFVIREKTGVSIDFTKEKKVDNVRHIFAPQMASKCNGRLDAVVNTLIIEYKHHSKLQTPKQISSAMQQVRDYLNALYKNESIKYNAILTDGTRISYFSFNGEAIQNTLLTALSNKDLDRIVHALVDNTKKKFVVKNILDDFAVDSISPSFTKDLALALYFLLRDKMTSKTKMLFEEWKVLMHLSTDDHGKSGDIEKRRADLSLIFQDDISTTEKEYMALYALQTTYAIIVKLISCKVVDYLKFNAQTNFFHDLTKITSRNLQLFFERMEDGYSYRSSNILNFLEGDFYSWYSDTQQWNADIWRISISIIKILDEYSTFSFNIRYEPIDIFKDLYMSIIPKSVRHSMGEYFTPQWLADYVVGRSLTFIKKKNWTAIDPCCGSGIFIVSLIKHMVGDVCLDQLSQKEKESMRTTILHSIFGIDINPLSVLSARVGYYLALLPFGSLKDIEIPIYLGDSALTPSTKIINGIKCYFYAVTNTKLSFEVLLPARLVMDSNFSIFMNQLQSYVKTDNADILSTVIKSHLTKAELESQTITESIEKLAHNLTILHKKHWDGIWIRVALNFMLIARLNKFDIIIGNPPWVKWEHLPAVYAKKIKKLCTIKHIFSNDGGQYGGTQLNICALISNVAATKWLSDDGVLTFLMPDSIMSQNSYEEFRNFYLEYEKKTRLYLQTIDRWKAPLRPFWSGNTVVSQDFNTYYFARKVVNYQKGIEVAEISSTGEKSNAYINTLLTFQEVKPYLAVTKNIAKQLSAKSTAFSYTSNQYDYALLIGESAYLFRTGVEFTPQELYMLIGARIDTSSSIQHFYNKRFSHSKYEIADMPTDGWEFPTKIIYPIVTGPSLRPFTYFDRNEFCILPYDPKRTKGPISFQSMVEENSQILAYLTAHKDLIDQQSEKSKQMHRGKEFYALSKIGPYTFAPYIVAARDNSKFCACVVKSKQTPWGEKKQVICVKHTIIISQDIHHRFISEDEAYFISGILNSDIVVNYIQDTFKSNGYSLNKAHLFIPHYDIKNALHRKIAGLAKKAAGMNENEVSTVTKTLTDIYLKICQEK